MKPVAMHPPNGPDVMTHNSTLFAASSRAGPVSDDCIAAACAEGQSHPPILGDGPEGEDPQIARQSGVLHNEEKGASQVEVGSLPGLDEIPELASMKAVPEVREALGSPAAQAKHQAALGESPSRDTKDVPHRSDAKYEDTKEEIDRTHSSSDVANQPAANQTTQLPEDVASPASSSEDAPGSDYDDFDGRPAFDEGPAVVAPETENPAQTRAENQIESRVESEAQPQVMDFAHMLLPEQNGDAEEESYEMVHMAEAEAETQEDHRSQLTEIESQTLPVPQPTPEWLPESAEASASGDIHGPPDSRREDDNANEVWNERMSALFGQIEEGSDAHERALSTHEPESAANDEVQSRHEDRPSESVPHEQPASPASLTRPAEDDAASSSKRQKVGDTVSVADHAAPIENSSVAGPKPKAPAKKAAPRPKAAPKPKKEVKPKAKKATQKASSNAPAPEPAVEPSQQPVTAQQPVPLQQAGSEENQAMITKLPATKPVKPRKAPAKPRKQQVKAQIESESVLQQPESQTSSVDPIATDLISTPPLPQPSASETTPAEPAVKGKAKAKPKPKAPSKAKSMAKASQSETSEQHDPIKQPEAQPMAHLPDSTKKPSKRASAKPKAKKAKGPIAKLLPAQADDAVSELELEPAQQIPAAFQPTMETQDPQDEQMAFEEPSHQNRGTPSEQGDHGSAEQYRQAVSGMQYVPANTANYQNSNIFSSMPPPMYPAQAYYPTRTHGVQQQQSNGLTSLTSAASMLDSETHWSQSPAIRQASVASDYEEHDERTSPTVMTGGSVAGDGESDATSFSPGRSTATFEIDPRFVPANWRYPLFDLMDPDLLMTTMREHTVWTFWDCYLPLGCRDQDLILLSNDGIAFPCAAWNPCLFSAVLKRVIKNPSQAVRAVMARGSDENRKALGYSPIPCVRIDENWHATNLLLSFLHPIPTIFLPDRATCRVVLDIGMRYGVDRAVHAASQRLNQIDAEELAAKSKGKARSTEEEIAADLAERAAEVGRR